MQFSASSLHTEREIAHLWRAWVCPVCGGIYVYCFACTAWERHSFCEGSVGPCYRTR